MFGNFENCIEKYLNQPYNISLKTKREGQSLQLLFDSGRIRVPGDGKAIDQGVAEEGTHAEFGTKENSGAPTVTQLPARRKTQG